MLLRTLLDSLPVYWMNLFSIPKTVIIKLDQCRKQFLWGSHMVNGVKCPKLHLLNWNKVCTGKSVGGLGIASLQTRNTSSLAKWWWRCYSERSKLWNKVLSEIYGTNFMFDLSSFIHYNSSSHIIISIVGIIKDSRVLPLLDRECFKWILGDGKTVMFWEDKWSPSGPLKSSLPGLFRISKLKIKISSSISPEKVLFR